MTNQSILLIINPLAGGTEKDTELQIIKNYVENQNYKFISYKGTGNQQHDKKQIIEHYQKYNPQKILIAGGDGTVKFVIETLFDKNVVFGILPMGSANGLAKDLDLPSDIIECLKIALKNNFKTIDNILINGMKSFHLSDLGLNAELIKNYHKSKIHGKLGYFLQMFPTILESQDPFNARITTPDTQIVTQARVILIANSSKYGTGVIVNPTGKIDDDIFEIVIFRNLDLLLILKILFGYLPLEDEAIEIIKTKKATIQTDIPISFQIDGEFCGEVRKLDIEMDTQKVKIATP
ncbi:sphingosine/diacylglycerol kinase-like enzyme [Bernardetia litoralis DSM 6794]|uniref:Sphingosine/diacylglycerol kinase-like enzyme n=1 Tax=Bernardetia litoralis (strain ATCC 23117 / DSM 6794 / NBRC 15988 / NCIMB 1366 / Fx l1 / Sio-4) TaxID=880071 RepID=I4AIQ9_BERLS|nr:diacylglycerol kinase family protein [Bernardetia litoralis]AFM03844.1 sphingosine/diacylglycerol kinase-like enzyme [Bernardetia litoralis DSM 6794]